MFLVVAAVLNGMLPLNAVFSFENLIPENRLQRWSSLNVTTEEMLEVKVLTLAIRNGGHRSHSYLIQGQSDVMYVHGLFLFPSP